MFRLIDNTPPVYSEESRDFQLFLRLYDSIVCSTKNDIDLIKYITDTKNCKTEILPLLQTKLGFKTQYSMSTDMLRAILEGFPELLRNKGSLKSIQQAINLFLKVLNIKTDLVIYYSEDGNLQVQQALSDHTIVIGINEAIDNYYVLEELMRYILPAGFGYVFYFYKTYERMSWLRDLNRVKFLVVGEEFADSIRYSNYDTTETYNTGDLVSYQQIIYKCLDDNVTGTWDSTKWEIDAVTNRLVNAINTLKVYGEDSDTMMIEPPVDVYEEEGYDF